MKIFPTLTGNRKAAQQRSGLRRADWRFLLPVDKGVFQHLALVGGPEGLADRFLEAGIARRVSTRLPATELVDAVAVLSPASADLGGVVDCLVPGGLLYYENDRRSPFRLAASPANFLRRLKRVGLLPTGIYWAAPDFEHCKRFIPLDVPEALEWYLSTLFVAGSPLHRLIEIGIQFYQGVWRKNFSALAPCYAVTAVFGTYKNTLPSVFGHPAFPAKLKVPGLRPVVLTSGQDEGSRVVILPFAPGCKQPHAVVKISTLSKLNSNTEREQEVLGDIRSHLDETMSQTIPLPLGLFHYGHLAVSIESFAEGNPILVSSGRWPGSFRQQQKDLRTASSWLIEFHCQAQAGRLLWDENAIERWIESRLVAYAQIFGLTPCEKLLFEKVRTRAKELIGATLPLVRMHYDFGPWNVYHKNQSFTVIDWEFGRNWERDRFGPPLYDLLYLITYWLHSARHLHSETAELNNLGRLFVQPDFTDPYTREVYDTIAKYLIKLDIDRRFMPLILVYLWVEQALHQYTRKHDLGQVKADTRLNNRCIKYLHVFAQNAENLFQQWLAGDT